MVIQTEKARRANFWTKGQNIRQTGYKNGHNNLTRQNVDNLYVSCTHRHIFYLSLVILLVLLKSILLFDFYHFSSSS